MLFSIIKVKVNVIQAPATSPFIWTTHFRQKILSHKITLVWIGICPLKLHLSPCVYCSWDKSLWPNKKNKPLKDQIGLSLQQVPSCVCTRKGHVSVKQSCYKSLQHVPSCKHYRWLVAGTCPFMCAPTLSLWQAVEDQSSPSWYSEDIT